MDILTSLRTKLTSLMKLQDEESVKEKAITKVAVAAIETAATSKTQGNRPFTNDQMIFEIKTIVKGNKEVLAILEQKGMKDSLDYQNLVFENRILNTYLPLTVDADLIRVLLTPQIEALKSFADDTKAMGLAMKTIKGSEETKGKLVDGNLVKEVVKELRNA